MDEEELYHLNLRSNDVYDLAADIALEFEKVADLCGSDVIRSLVNKIVIVLEHLEDAVLKTHSMLDCIIDLRRQIRDLKIKKLTNEENKMKFEQDLADAEESWMAEMQSLKENLIRLESDNEQLRNLLQEQCYKLKQDIKSDENAVEELKNVVAKLNLMLKEKDSLLDKHAKDISMMKSVIEEQGTVNKTLHTKISESQIEIMNLWKEKTNLEMKISKQEESLGTMQQQLNASVSSKLDTHETSGSRQTLSIELDEESIYDESLKYYKEERELLLTRINSLQSELIDSQNEIDSFRRSTKEIAVEDAANNDGSSIRQLFRSFRESMADERDTFRC